MLWPWGGSDFRWTREASADYSGATVPELHRLPAHDDARLTIGRAFVNEAKEAKMPPRLTLVANASTPATRASAFPLDESLDDFGRRDASALAGEFQHLSIALCSPAKRAIETASLLGLNTEIDLTLRDLDVGRWAGCSLCGIAQSESEAMANWLSDPAAAAHGGESVEGLFGRMSVWLRSMSDRQGHILAVTHPSVIRVVILAAIHASPTSYWHIDIAPLSVVELTSNGKRWALKSIKN